MTNHPPLPAPRRSPQQIAEDNGLCRKLGREYRRTDTPKGKPAKLSGLRLGEVRKKWLGGSL